MKVSRADFELYNNGEELLGTRMLELILYPIFDKRDYCKLSRLSYGTRSKSEFWWIEWMRLSQSINSQMKGTDAFGELSCPEYDELLGGNCKHLFSGTITSYPG